MTKLQPLVCPAGVGPRHITGVLVPEALARWLAEGVELKDVVNLAFYEFFERGHYLSMDEPTT